ncbi:MAG: hypothetical protein NTZ19_08715 [Bacteroidetes bacterium]|nr:hypothetical protein [Bacteroidota bacterium]
MEKLKLLSIVFLLFSISCRLDSHDVSETNMKYQFDQRIIEKLPIYDSLATAILEKLSFFQQQINQKDSYRAYKYIPSSDEPDVFKKLPQEIAPKIDKFFNSLGKDFIYGFDVFKDSTIKIRIRNSLSENSPVEIEENLSYFPTTIKIHHKEMPVRDTILNTHWQYWVRFNKQGLIRGL